MLFTELIRSFNESENGHAMLISGKVLVVSDCVFHEYLGIKGRWQYFGGDFFLRSFSSQQEIVLNDYY